MSIINKLNIEQKILLEYYVRYGKDSEIFQRYYNKKVSEYKRKLYHLSEKIYDKKLKIKLNELKKNYDKLFEQIDDNSIKALMKLMFLKN